MKSGQPQPYSPEKMTRFLVLIPFIFVNLLFSEGAAQGWWQLLQHNMGISAMHMQLLNNGRVIMFDRTDFGRSNISLPRGKCGDNDEVVKPDYTAHSVEYNVESNSIRPLMVLTNTWCSSGAVMMDGHLVQTGGFGKGERKVRTFRPCNRCDWEEGDNKLLVRRWYATNHILPDTRQIIIGGRRQFNYEFFPKVKGGDKLYYLHFLTETNDPKIENNLYPFVFLVPNGNLFIFANNRAILLDYKENVIVARYPTIPGRDPRNYPSSGSAVLLPLKNLSSGNIKAEVMVCGGAPKGSHELANKGISFIKALDTCARIEVFGLKTLWVVEKMPMPRVMGDMTLLPDGSVLIINGAASGTAGWEDARDPVLNPIIYKPEYHLEHRFKIQKPSPIPRMYHSTTILLRDGRVLVGGSNPHVRYNFTNVLFPTELRLEAFSPPYMGARRPKISSPLGAIPKFKYRQRMTIGFTIPGNLDWNRVAVTLAAPSFTTHSFSMNQRTLFLDGLKATRAGTGSYKVEVNSPPSANLAPPGYYMLFVVYQDTPSRGLWIHIS